jgi:hypothetical protein
LDEEEAGRLSRAFFGGEAAADRFNGRKPVLGCRSGAALEDLGFETAWCIDAILEPKKLPNPPIVLLMSGSADIGDDAESAVVATEVPFVALFGSAAVSTC